jgi:ectoine hydroxylase-related dioxygenase (phytanoyl-CoA dioxygenase family)
MAHDGAITAEQRWAFDLDGYVVLPALLSPQQASDAATAAAAATTLADTPALLAAIRGLAGGEMPLHHRAAYDGTPSQMQEHHPIEHMLDRPPRRLLPPSSPAEQEWATDSSIDGRRRLGYDMLSRPDCVCIWGLRAVWALGASDSVLVVSPCTHKSNVHPPPTVVRAAAMGATLEIKLQPGDCLLAVATTLVAAGPAAGELLECMFVDSTRTSAPRRPLASAVDTAWHEALTPAQLRLIAPTRGLGHDGQPLSEDEQLYHSVLTKNTRPDAPDHDEVWFWDTRGYLVLHNMMDSQWLEDANAALDSDYAQTQRGEVGIVDEVHLDPACSQRIAPAPGTRISEERVSNTWSLPAPFGDAFRKMIDHPPVMARLKWMVDAGFMMTTCYTIVSRDGAAGQGMHGGFSYGRGPQYSFENGMPRTEQVNFGWVLRDVSTAAGDGGLVLIPGSHKGRLPLPRPSMTSCDLPQVKHLEAKAGTVILYTGTTTHGVRSWRNPLSERRFTNTKAGPHLQAPYGAAGPRL